MRKSIVWLLAVILAVSIFAFYYMKNNKSPEVSGADGKNRIADSNSQKTGNNLLEGIDESELFVITRRTEGGAVTVDVAFLNILKPQEKDLAFYVVMNTHTVDLSSYDIGSVAVLSNGQETVSRGFTWEPISDDGHHRSGILRVKNNGIFNEKTKFIELNLRGIAGVLDRKYRWDNNDWSK
ncbi:hypothetical protein [Thermoanaerobacterium sp. DL9XJH110]|jgi:hypothetical protein|uniref:hypothetical protein n=1 Tax=Thermoanaerobacterium sp. DL9XJH110 TaxID=3386643 RepID=UPI003BB5E36A